jgi:hypothetical protein
MQTTVLIEGQEGSFARIAAMPRLNSYGGPNLHHLAAIAALNQRDRGDVLQAFADDVHFNLSVNERLGIAAACAEAELQRMAVN